MTPGVQLRSGDKDGIRAAVAGEDQVLVEGRLEGARVGDAQHGGGRLDVVGDAEARLRLVGAVRPL